MVLKDITRHLGVPFLGANIIAKCLRLLPPDDPINLNLRDGARRFPRWDGLAQDGADAEEETTQHEGHQGACPPRPLAPAIVYGCARPHARGITHP
jgi:hypothetical protein